MFISNKAIDIYIFCRSRKSADCGCSGPWQACKAHYVFRATSKHARGCAWRIGMACGARSSHSGQSGAHLKMELSLLEPYTPTKSGSYSRISSKNHRIS